MPLTPFCATSSWLSTPHSAEANTSLTPCRPAQETVLLSVSNAGRDRPLARLASRLVRSLTADR